MTDDEPIEWCPGIDYDPDRDIEHTCALRVKHGEAHLCSVCGRRWNDE